MEQTAQNRLYYYAMLFNEDDYEGLNIQIIENMLVGRDYKHFPFELSFKIGTILKDYEAFYNHYGNGGEFGEYRVKATNTYLDSIRSKRGKPVEYDKYSTITKLNTDVYKDFYTYYISNIDSFYKEEVIDNFLRGERSIRDFKSILKIIYNEVKWYVDEEFAMEKVEEYSKIAIKDLELRKASYEEVEEFKDEFERFKAQDRNYVIKVKSTSRFTEIE